MFLNQHNVEINKYTKLHSISSLLCSLLSKYLEYGRVSANEPCLLQPYIRQISIALLNSRVYFFMAGLGVLLWHSCRAVGLNWSNDNNEMLFFHLLLIDYLHVAVCYDIYDCSWICGVNYTISTAGYYSRVRVNSQETRERETARV